MTDKNDVLENHSDLSECESVFFIRFISGYPVKSASSIRACLRQTGSILLFNKKYDIILF